MISICTSIGFCSRSIAMVLNNNSVSIYAVHVRVFQIIFSLGHDTHSSLKRLPQYTNMYKQ